MLSKQNIIAIKQEYVSWRALIPSDIAKNQLIGRKLRKNKSCSKKLCLGELMHNLIQISNVAKSLGVQQKDVAMSIIEKYQQQQQPQQQQPCASQSQLPTQTVADVPTPDNFRQLIEQRAGPLGILFCPQNRTHEGRQIYYFGDHSIYLDGTIIYMFSNQRKKWQPIGIESLIQISHPPA